MAKREGNIIYANDEALLPEGIDFETIDRTLWSPDLLRLEIDNHMASGRIFQHSSQGGDPLGRKHHRQMPF
jgi:hypothetical protein